MKKRKTTKKIKSPKVASVPTIKSPPLHVSFPFTLYHKSEKKLCYFSDDFHMKKYIERCKLTPKDYTISKTAPKQDG